MLTVREEYVFKLFSTIYNEEIKDLSEVMDKWKSCLREPISLSYRGPL